MEEMDTVASVVGVTVTGFRLSLILNAISCEVTQAPPEIHETSKTITYFSLTLKEVGIALQAVDSVHSKDAVEAAKQISDDANNVFTEIEDMLDRVRMRKGDSKSRASAQQRIKWCFKKNRTNYLLAQLECLKLGLDLISQVLRLGKIMSSASKSDPADIVKEKTAAMHQERAEIQNTLIVRHMQIKATEGLFQYCELDETEPLSPPESMDEADNDSQITIKAPPEFRSSLTMIRLPTYHIGEIDQMLKQVDQSSKNMIQLSSQAIDPLLENWTRWREVREQKHAKSQSKYNPTIYNLEEDEFLRNERYDDNGNGHRGYYLEGVTSDWRKPNSAAARQEYTRRKKQYAGYQASVGVYDSDPEDSPASNASAKRTTKHHVVNSSPESSGSESELRGKKLPVRFQPGPPLERSIPSQPASNQSTPPNQFIQSRMPPSPAQSVGGKPTLSPQYIPPTQGTRPYATPDQNVHFHHSVSMPLPPVYTHNAPNAYVHNSPSSATHHHPQYWGQPGMSTPRSQAQAPNRINTSSRPISRDGKGGRSPSRLSQEIPRDQDKDRDRDRDRQRERDKDRDRDAYRDAYRDYDRDHPRYDKQSKGGKHKALREGATKGILSGLALGGFLEALQDIVI